VEFWRSAPTWLSKLGGATDRRALSGVVAQVEPKQRVVRAAGEPGTLRWLVQQYFDHDAPAMSFAYDDILRRTKDVCVDESPVGSSVSESLAQMAKLAKTIQEGLSLSGMKTSSTSSNRTSCSSCGIPLCWARWGRQPKADPNPKREPKCPTFSGGDAQLGISGS
jgi:hypothetical protein